MGCKGEKSISQIKMLKREHDQMQYCTLDLIPEKGHYWKNWQNPDKVGG